MAPGKSDHFLTDEVVHNVLLVDEWKQLELATSSLVKSIADRW